MAYTPPDGDLLRFDLEGADYSPPSGDSASFDLRFYPAYVPPAGNVVGLEFGDEYTPPEGNVVGLEFAQSSDPEEDRQFVFPVGADQLIIGALAIRLQFRQVSVPGVSYLSFGSHSAMNKRAFLVPPNFVATRYGTASLINAKRSINPAGLAASAFGASRIYNLRQYIRPEGYSAGLYGTAFMQGGVKYVTPSGLPPVSIPPPQVVNTTANRALLPQGINSMRVGSVAVSPQTVFTFGFIGSIGFPTVRRNPSPLGFDTSSWGRPTIYFKTRTLHATGIDSFATGFPNIRDRAQKVFHIASPVTAVFGDIAARLKTMRLTVPGFSSFDSSIFAEIRSTRRFLQASSILAPAFGPATEIRNKTPSLAPSGFAATQFGRADHMVIGWRIRSVYPVGVPAPLGPLGIPILWQTPGLRPLGIAVPDFPTPTIWPAIRTVEAKGRDAQLIGETVVTFRYRTVKPDTFTATRYGTGRIEHGNRRVEMVGAPHTRYGAPWVSYGLRLLTVTGIAVPGIPIHRVGGTRYIHPGGYDAARFGTRIIPEARTVAPLGSVNTYGLAVVRNRKLYIRPASILTTPQPADSWGTARVHNSRQYITMTFDFASELNPPPIVGWTSVLNRNRIVGAFGTVSPAPSMPRIENAGRVIQPGGIDKPALPIKSMVAYRIRRFYLDGLEPVPISRWGVVYNTADVLQPTGAAPGQFGLQGIINTRRFYKFIGNFDSQDFGTAFVAPAIRTIPLEPRYAIAPPIIPLPGIKLYTRYVEPQGADLVRIGGPSLVIKFNIVWPRWVLQHFFGVASLRNVTPELLHKGRSSEEFGIPSIRTQWRTLPVDGTNTQRFGATKIADRKQFLSVAGNNYGVVSALHKVTKTGAPPYWPQYITVDEGIDNEIEVSKPGLNQYVLYPQSAAPMTQFGDAMVRSNVIAIDAGIATEWYGEPNVMLKRRVVEPEGWHHDNTPSAPRLSPLTVWAVKEAPAQAKANHPPAALHYVGETAFDPPGTRFGFHKVFIPRDSLERATAGSWMRLGMPSVELSRRYLAPKSMTPFRFGFHALGDGTLFVKQFASHDSHVFGTPGLVRPPYTGPQTIRPQGLNALGIPILHWASLKTRRLNLTGFDALRTGSSRGESPYQWQSLHVGPPMPTMPAGISSELWGTAWISLRVRNLDVQGFDSFLCEYDLESFAKRLRIENASKPSIPARTITPVGVDGLTFGVPNVRLGVHYIRPDGNSDQHRKGAW